MKKLIVIILAGFLITSCANSPSNENGAPVDSSANAVGGDTTGGYNANSGNVNTKTGNTQIDSSRIDSNKVVK